jgi:hypothetical protein
MVYYQTKNPNLGKFCWVLQWKRVAYFMAILVYFRPFSILLWHLVICGYLVYFMIIKYFFPFWYFVPGKIWQPWPTWLFAENGSCNKKRLNKDYCSKDEDIRSVELSDGDPLQCDQK